MRYSGAWHSAGSRWHGQRLSIALAICVAALVLALGFQSGVLVFPDGTANLQRWLQQQFDADYESACLRFGFARGSARFLDCKLELADLQRRHDKLIEEDMWP